MRDSVVQWHIFRYPEVRLPKMKSANYFFDQFRVRHRHCYIYILLTVVIDVTVVTVRVTCSLQVPKIYKEAFCIYKQNIPQVQSAFDIPRCLGYRFKRLRAALLSPKTQFGTSVMLYSSSRLALGFPFKGIKSTTKESLTAKTESSLRCGSILSNICVVTGLQPSRITYGEVHSQPYHFILRRGLL